MIRHAGNNYRRPVEEGKKQTFLDYHIKLGVADLDFALTSSQYANELLLMGNQNQALLVTSFIPSVYENLKKKLIFDILSMKALYFQPVDT